MKPEVQIFTDGSCPKPQGPGGWAHIIRITATGAEFKASGGELGTTNNRQELRAVLEALKYLNRAGRPFRVKIVGDSQYVLKGITEWTPKWKRMGWRKKKYSRNDSEEIMNLDLWKEIDRLIVEGGHEVEVEWVRGHNGHPENEWCDQAAGEATKAVLAESKKQVSKL